MPATRRTRGPRSGDPTSSLRRVGVRGIIGPPETIVEGWECERRWTWSRSDRDGRGTVCASTRACADRRSPRRVEGCADSLPGSVAQPLRAMRLNRARRTQLEGSSERRRRRAGEAGSRVGECALSRSPCRRERRASSESTRRPGRWESCRLIRAGTWRHRQVPRLRVWVSRLRSLDRSRLRFIGS